MTLMTLPTPRFAVLSGRRISDVLKEKGYFAFGVIVVGMVLIEAYFLEFGHELLVAADPAVEAVLCSLWCKFW